MPAEVRMLEQIEQFIDAVGLDGVLDIVADVCEVKSEHIRTNWGPSNDYLAGLWARWAEQIRQFKKQRA